MIHVDHVIVAIAAIAFVAALVNGGLGYGFSSITVPVALLFISNKLLSPALVLLELFINCACLALNGRAAPNVWRRMLPLIAGILPGAALGTFALAETSHANLRLVTYLVLLPLILLQAAGVRWPIQNERVAGPPLGAGVGLLYAATTISGPPLALLLNNQGYTQSEFRAALSLFRIVETLVTAALYAGMGLFTRESAELSIGIAPAVLLGLPIGCLVLRRLSSETFRRICMGADALLVSFGLARALMDHHWLGAALGGALVAAVVALEVWLIWRYAKLARAQASLEFSRAP